MTGVVRTLFVLAGLAELGACGFVPEQVSRADVRVVRMFTAMAKVDRASMGFTEIPADAPMRLESRPRAGYDAMLHIGGKTRRTVGFRRSGENYTWIHEQEIFEGPRTYDTPDGVLKESITITFESAHVSGVPLNQLTIFYAGPDRMAFDENLALAMVRPVLARWGYYH